MHLLMMLNISWVSDRVTKPRNQNNMKRSMNCYIDLGMNCDHGRPSHTTLVYPAAVSAKDSHGSLLSSSRGLLGEGRLRSFPKRHSLKCLRLCAEYQLCTFYRVVHVNVIELIMEEYSSLCIYAH